MLNVSLNSLTNLTKCQKAIDRCNEKKGCNYMCSQMQKEKCELLCKHMELVSSTNKT